MDYLRNALKDNNKKVSVANIYMLATIFIQFIFVYLFIKGTASFYERTVTVSGALKLITSLFSDAALEYTYKKICGTVLGIYYLVVLLFIVKNLITAIRIYKISRKDPKSDGDYYETTVFIVAGRASSSFVSILTFMVCCSLLKSYDLSFRAILLIVLGIITFLSVRILLFFINRFDDRSVIINTAYLAIFIFTIGLILANADYYTPEDLFNGFKALLSSANGFLPLFTVIATLIACLANIILVFVALYVLHSAYYLYTEPHEVHRGTRLIILLSGVILGVALITHVVRGGGLGPRALITLMTPYLTLLFPAIALFLYTKFPVEVTVLEATQDETEAPEKDPDGKSEQM